MHRFAAGEGHGRGPQWIIRRGNQHFITAVQQRLHRLDDKFGHAVADVNVFYRYVAHAARLVVLHDGFTGGVQPFGVAVTLCGRQVADHVDQNLIRRVKPERCWVTDVKFENFIAFFFKAFCLFKNRATNVVTNVV